MRLIFIVMMGLALQACGAGSTLVLEPTSGPREAYTAATIVHSEDTATVPEKILVEFKKSMDKEFYEEGIFQNGQGLVVNYRFVQFEAGNQFSRWFWGGIGNAGEASLTVEVVFERPDGTSLSKIHVAGKIGSGFFGGSVSEALNKAAREAAEYAAGAFH